ELGPPSLVAGGASRSMRRNVAAAFLTRFVGQSSTIARRLPPPPRRSLSSCIVSTSPSSSGCSRNMFRNRRAALDQFPGLRLADGASNDLRDRPLPLFGRVRKPLVHLRGQPEFHGDGVLWRLAGLASLRGLRHRILLV